MVNTVGLFCCYLYSMHWQTLSFLELDTDQLYAILKVRQEVFVIEQKCFYLDTDGVDQVSYHVIGRNEKGGIIAYARLIPAGVSYTEVSMGRVLVVKQARGKGLGRELTRRCLEEVGLLWGPQPVRLSAQAYLVKFYEDFGFHTVGEAYLDAGIPHIEMLRPI